MTPVLTVLAVLLGGAALAVFSCWLQIRCCRHPRTAKDATGDIYCADCGKDMAD